jgi:hypothetical protein
MGAGRARCDGGRAPDHVSACWPMSAASSLCRMPAANPDQEKSPVARFGEMGPVSGMGPDTSAMTRGPMPSWAVSAVRRILAIVIPTLGWEVGEGKCPESWWAWEIAARWSSMVATLRPAGPGP